MYKKCLEEMSSEEKSEPYLDTSPNICQLNSSHRNQIIEFLNKNRNSLGIENCKKGSIKKFVDIYLNLGDTGKYLVFAIIKDKIACVLFARMQEKSFFMAKNCLNIDVLFGKQQASNRVLLSFVENWAINQGIETIRITSESGNKWIGSFLEEKGFISSHISYRKNISIEKFEACVDN